MFTARSRSPLTPSGVREPRERHRIRARRRQRLEMLNAAVHVARLQAGRGEQAVRREVRRVHVDRVAAALDDIVVVAGDVTDPGGAGVRDQAQRIELAGRGPSSPPPLVLAPGAEQQAVETASAFVAGVERSAPGGTTSSAPSQSQSRHRRTSASATWASGLASDREPARARRKPRRRQAPRAVRAGSSPPRRPWRAPARRAPSRTPDRA